MMLAPAPQQADAVSIVASTVDGAFFASGYRGEGAIAAVMTRNSPDPVLSAFEYSLSRKGQLPAGFWSMRHGSGAKMFADSGV